MPKNANIAMTTATGMGPLPAVLERMVGARAVDRAFEATGLPLDLVENRDHKIPMTAMIELFNAAEREAGDEVFGLLVGREMGPATYGLWTQYSLQGKTAEDAILRLCRTIGLHQSGGSMELKRQNGHAIWTYKNPSHPTQMERAHAEHIVPVMIAFLRSFLGPRWLPDRIGVPFENDGKTSTRTDLFGSDWCYSKSGVSLIFPANALTSHSLRAPDTQVITEVEYEAEKKLKEAPSPAQVVKEMIALRLLDGKWDIEGAARLAHQSLRTFQRNLDRDGLSYSKMLNVVRRDRAIALLQGTELSITEIALDLGYSDPANFTRAFRSWEGQSPLQMRKRVHTAPRD